MASSEQAELASNAAGWAAEGQCHRASGSCSRASLTLCLFVVVVAAAAVRPALRGQCQSCSSFPYRTDWQSGLCIAFALVFCALLSLLLTHQAEVSELN